MRPGFPRGVSCSSSPGLVTGRQSSDRLQGCLWSCLAPGCQLSSGINETVNPLTFTFPLKSAAPGRADYKKTPTLGGPECASPASPQFCSAFWLSRSIWLDSHRRLGTDRPGTVLTAPASCEPRAVHLPIIRSTGPLFLSQSPLLGRFPVWSMRPGLY